MPDAASRRPLLHRVALFAALGGLAVLALGWNGHGFDGPTAGLRNFAQPIIAPFFGQEPVDNGAIPPALLTVALVTALVAAVIEWWQRWRGTKLGRMLVAGVRPAPRRRGSSAVSQAPDADGETRTWDAEDLRTSADFALYDDEGLDSEPFVTGPESAPFDPDAEFGGPASETMQPAEPRLGLAERLRLFAAMLMESRAARVARSVRRPITPPERQLDEPPALPLLSGTSDQPQSPDPLLTGGGEERES